MTTSVFSTSGKADRHGWWRSALDSPRKLWLRRAIFQAHLWIGIAVGLISTVVGASGSALVYREALDRLLAPKLHHVQSTARLTVDQIAERVRQAYPGMTVQYLEPSVATGSEADSWVVYLAKPTPDKPAKADDDEAPRTMVYVDPSNGKILGQRADQQGIMPWLADLHYRLLGGETGQKVNGIAAALLFLLTVSGLILWWPGRQHIRSSIRIHWRARWPRLQWDLHTAGGFWLSLPLSILSFTGVYFSFGLPAIAVVLILFGGSPKDLIAIFVPPHSTVPAVHQPAAPLQPMLETIRQHYPTANRVFLQLPAKPEDSVSAFVSTPESERVGGRALFNFDQYSGKLIREYDSRNAPFAARAYLQLNAIHFGVFAGQFSKVLWVFIGLTPGLLFFTGFFMWLRKIRAKRRAKRKTSNSKPSNKILVAS